MRREYSILVGVIVLVLAGLGWFLFGVYTWVSRTNVSYQVLPDGRIEAVSSSTNEEHGSLTRRLFGGNDENNFITNVAVRASDLEVPTALVRLSDGRLLYAERPGRVGVINLDGSRGLVATISDVVASGESGLLGMTLGKDTHELYLFYTYRYSTGGLSNKVVKYVLGEESSTLNSLSTTTQATTTESKLILSNEDTVLDRIPGGTINNGGTLSFGPDGYLWVLTGDSGRGLLAQDVESLAGKILRIDETGNPALDNPLSGSAVYASGFRSPSGITWQTSTKVTFVSDSGNDGFDEINQVEKGGNFGWPIAAECKGGDSRFINPVVCSGRTKWVPGGLVYLAGEGQKSEKLLMAGLDGRALLEFLLPFSTSSQNMSQVLVENSYGRLRGPVQIGGDLFLLTSNRDGRGTFIKGDDQIISFDLLKE